MKNIIIQGDCKIDRIRELHRLFLKHFNGTKEKLEIDMSEIERCDLSFLQLVCSACRSFGEKNTTLVFLNPLPEKVLEQSKKAGLESACRICSRDDCPLRQAISSFQSGTSGDTDH